MFFVFVHNWESPSDCNSFPRVAEFSRVCRVSFGAEAEDQGVRVSFNTHTGRFPNTSSDIVGIDVVKTL